MVEEISSCRISSVEAFPIPSNPNPAINKSLGWSCYILFIICIDELFLKSIFSTTKHKNKLICQAFEGNPNSELRNSSYNLVIFRLSDQLRMATCQCGIIFAKILCLISRLLGEMKENGIPMSMKRFLVFSQPRYLSQIIIILLLSIIVVLASNYSINHILLKICLVFIYLTPAWYILKNTLIYTHSILCLLKNNENCLSFVISYLSCQMFMIVLFVSYCLKPSMLISTEYETVISNEKYSKLLDVLTISDGNKNEKKLWIEAILAYILSIITISHFCRTIPFRNIILKNTSFISNLNSKHLKITLNYAFSIRPFKGTLPITSKGIISILSVVMRS